MYLSNLKSRQFSIPQGDSSLELKDITFLIESYANSVLAKQSEDVLYFSKLHFTYLSDGVIRESSLGDKFILTKEANLKSWISNLKSDILLATEEYQAVEVIGKYIQYFIIDKSHKYFDHYIKEEVKPIITKATTLPSNHKYPLTMDVTKWGGVVMNNISNTTIFTDILYSNSLLNIFKTKSREGVIKHIYTFFNEENIKKEVITDVRLKNMPENSFFRYVKGVRYEIVNGELVAKTMATNGRISPKTDNPFGDNLYSPNNPVKQRGVVAIVNKNNPKVDNGKPNLLVINKTDTASKFIFDDSVITFDVETRNISDIDSKNRKIVKMELVSIAWYRGSAYSSVAESKTFHILDYSSVEDMIKAFLDSLFLNPLNDGCVVYAHNLGNFDLAFIEKYLADYCSEYSKIENKGKFISIRAKLNHPSEVDSKGKPVKITLTFYDSINMLSSSLRDLAILYKVELKGEFDFTLNDTQQGLIDNRESLLEYNLQDCITLYQVLRAFAETVFNEYGVNIINYATAPGLAFTVFRSNYLNSDKIYITTAKEYSLLKPAYVGGHVDIYKPITNPDKPVYCYDVNSLYPFVMRDNLFPVGAGTYIIKDGLNWENSFGVVKANVFCPKSIKLPLLMIHRGTVALAPTGHFSGMWTTVELLKAKALGYTIHATEGIFYDSEVLFHDYVSDIYAKRKANKGTPIDAVCKLMLNSLYGRFGMNPNMTKIEFMRSLDSVNVLEVKKSEPLGEAFLIHSDDIKNEIINERAVQISLPIAIFTTSYARLEIYKHKEYIMSNFEDSLYYSDTDSVFTGDVLPESVVGKELGQMKLEFTAKEAVFIAPKVYGYLFDDDTFKIKFKGGSPSGLPYDSFKELLNENHELNLPQKRWAFSSHKAAIILHTIDYHIKATSNKREIVYVNGKAVKTNSIYISQSVDE